MKNKITLSEIIAKKKQGEMDKFAVSYFDSEVLGGTIEIKKIPIKKFMEIQDIASDNEMEGLGLALFECLPIFKEDIKDAMNVYEVETPSDLVLAVFEDNVGEMMKIMTEINKLYGIKEDESLDEKIDEEIKN